MLILAIESSCRRGGVAILRDGRVLGERSMDSRINRSAGLVVAVDELLCGCGREREEIDGIGVDVGPGSFTGVRVGIAAAKGLARGLSASLCGVTSLEALVSACATGRRHLFPLVDARGGLFYGALFDTVDGRLVRRTEIRLWTPRDLPRAVPDGTYFLGPGLSEWRDEIIAEMGEGAVVDPEDRFPGATEVAKLAEKKIREGSPSPPAPIYLKSYVKKRRE